MPRDGLKLVWSGVGFWLTWTVVSAVTYVGGLALAYMFGPLIAEVISSPLRLLHQFEGAVRSDVAVRYLPWLFAAVSIGAAGASVGYCTANAQARLLDFPMADRRRWVLAGIVGWTAGLPMALAVTVLLGRFETALPRSPMAVMAVSIAGLVLNSEVGGLSSGLVTGIGQWRVLRRFGPNAVAWMLSTTIAAGLGWWITRSLSWDGQ